MLYVVATCCVPLCVVGIVVVRCCALFCVCVSVCALAGAGSAGECRCCLQPRAGLCARGRRGRFLLGENSFSGRQAKFSASDHNAMECSTIQYDAVQSSVVRALDRPVGGKARLMD